MISRALVFQHMDDEPPGLFGEFLRERGAELDIVMLHRGEEIPSLAPYDFLLVMGGAMDVWETEAHPWLVDEKRAIKEWAINRNRPFLGICLGLQLLAEALGGKIGVASKPEARIGIGKYLHFYNTKRPHQALDGNTPDKAYFTPLQLPAAA